MSTDQPVLRAERVREVFTECLFRDGEDTTRHIAAEGIMVTIGFHPERTEEHRQEIHNMLAELPADFKESGGGGTTFLNACQNGEGEQWTSAHATMDQLFMLGLAIGEVEYLLGREVWPLLPGGMPYLVIKQ